jgi:aryl-alcohol dehydrogenase-like predicted oxidoreductase
MADRSMPSVLLGATGLPVSRLGLGLAALGRPAYINLGHGADLGDDRGVASLEERCHQVLDAAVAAGIRYVDAARSYGRAEAFLGSWLRARPESPPVTVGSKWGYSYVGGWRTDAPVHEVKDLTAETLRRQIVESRNAIGHRLALYQIHSATLDSGVLDDAAVLRDLVRLRAEGLAVGLSVTGAQQADTIRRALTVTVDGVHLFQTVQATWNLLEPSAEAALAEAHAAGLGVIVKEALANGRVLDAGEAAAATVAREAALLRTTADAYALAAALSRPWAHVVLSGAVTLNQLESNLDAVRVAELIETLPRIAESPAVYWQRRSKLVWN